MPTLTRRSLTVLAVLALTLGAVQPVTASAAAQPTAWAEMRYLALGDSLAAGYQPGQPEHRYGGYVGRVLDHLRSTAGPTRLTNLSCSGETSATMVDGGRCPYDAGSQLAQAVMYLQEHAGDVRLVTLDIGANDVVSCASPAGIDPACVAEGMSQVAARLPVIMAGLRAAAPDVPIVLLNYYDAILAFWLLGPAGEQTARASVALMQRLNGIIATAGAAVGAQTADVATAFSSTEFDTTAWWPEVGQIPYNVSRICRWTHMCTQFDIHANDQGYGVMAGAVIDVLTGTTAGRRSAA